MYYRFRRLLFFGIIRNLFSGRIHMIVFLHNQLGDGHNRVSLLFQIGQHGIQRICRIFCSVVAENNGSECQCFMIAHRCNNRIHPIILPVETVHRPLDRVIVQGIRRLDHIVIIGPIGRAKQIHLISGQFFYFIVHGLQFAVLLDLGNRRHIIVMFTVIPQIMASLHQFFHTVRVIVHPSSGHKKSHFY